jgi:UDP-N-acetylenolpyruvoylglucosamine reductase
MSTAEGSLTSPPGAPGSAAAPSLAKFREELRGLLSPETEVRQDEALARKTTLRVGGPADLYVEPASEADLAVLLRQCQLHHQPWMLLGRGSNLLIRDGGWRGVVICLARPAFTRVEATGCLIRAGAGVRLKAVALEARRQGLAGLEFLEGIPGSLGGALRMNAGAMGWSIFDRVEQIRVMEPDGQVRECGAPEVQPAYRACPWLKRRIALGAVLRGTPTPVTAIDQRMQSYSQQRWASQPSAPSAGCIFKNPPSIPAGKLIDELGLKGLRVGGAAISQVHANFIVNDQNATAQDILRLIELVRERVRTLRGIELETEVEIIGQ